MHFERNRPRPAEIFLLAGWYVGILALGLLVPDSLPIVVRVILIIGGAAILTAAGVRFAARYSLFADQPAA